ncbi:glutamate synthase [Candidatus Altiarchaeota archaeon]
MKRVMEGGCGVVGFSSTVKLPGKYLLVPCVQMHNRGNGKGGGVVACGLDHKQMKVPKEVLDSHYLIQVAYLDESCMPEVEEGFINSCLELHSSYEVKSLTDHGSCGLNMRPPRVVRYFVKVKGKTLAAFMKAEGIKEKEKAEDEFIYRNTVKLNSGYYASLGTKRAFVLSHGKNMMIFKIVGYAEQAIQFYLLEEVKANIWMGHQRYPTKGVVWHPGGAHPFIGLNDALVHNGDLANYFSLAQYLKQKGRGLQFLTDTEAAAQLFDLYSREYGYPLEYVIEAMAPTTERDFLLLPSSRQTAYHAIQKTHIQESPDGPWFFIIARNDTKGKSLQLIGITDTSMLRPQVFALQRNAGVEIGLIASEKQAIDATLGSIAGEDDRFLPIADTYWNARGGSYSDGGSFIFTIKDKRLTCTNKFGDKIPYPKGGSYTPGKSVKAKFRPDFQLVSESIKDYEYPRVRGLMGDAVRFAKKGDPQLTATINTLTKLVDFRYDLGGKKRSAVLTLVNEALNTILSGIDEKSSQYARITYPADKIPKAGGKSRTLVIDAHGFAPEGPQGIARTLSRAYHQGWRNLIYYNLSGQRFIGCGLGPHNEELRVDIYGSSGDYIGSGIQNMKILIHGNAQDQLCQIMSSGKVIVYGDVGQTFLYGGKGGECYVMGNACGRPMINAVGSIKCVINGTCLDYLAESFMAGDPLAGGGFVIVNAVSLGEDGKILDLESPYPGGNLFSLSSGGAIYIRDPYMKLSDDQLNGGQYVPLTPDDWALIEPYLKENEELFGIRIEDLLTVEGRVRYPEEVYRKVTVTEEVLE